ncbi:hypothetical protein CKAH01_05047 [Colletotrichum kahawae]|uniref:Uncharacterized protein n=1 Tax=Colletotrichum kahawae TaxID=34407 RepID=A0AAD9YH81_COLKA|nr:hypothetical protein CKAH01_05047 [Colletotrichum kahawae]
MDGSTLNLDLDLDLDLDPAGSDWRRRATGRCNWEEEGWDAGGKELRREGGCGCLGPAFFWLDREKERLERARCNCKCKGDLMQQCSSQQAARAPSTEGRKRLPPTSPREASEASEATSVRPTSAWTVAQKLKRVDRRRLEPLSFDCFDCKNFPLWLLCIEPWRLFPLAISASTTSFDCMNQSHGSFTVVGLSFNASMLDDGSNARTFTPEPVPSVWIPSAVAHRGKLAFSPAVQGVYQVRSPSF